MNLHYFNEPEKAAKDLRLVLAIEQGYVPSTCLLSGMLVLYEVTASKDPCADCNGDRKVCQGRSKK